MNQPFSLRAPLAENTAAHPQDVLAVKTFLQRLGHYKAPDWGITPFPDAALFAAVRAFQQAQGLHADGVMKQGGKTEATIRSTAQRLQAMGRNGDTLLAHITPAEAQLLDAVTDGGSINPRTGLMEFWGRMGGSNYSRAQREESDHRAASAEREKNNTQQSGDWSSERNRSLGYNDFNPGGLHGDKNLNGTKKTGEELDRHLRTVQAQLEKEAADAAAKIQALAVKQAADARRLREDEAKAAKDLARSFNVAQQKAQQDTPKDAGLLTESTPAARSFAAPATPNEATQNDAPLGFKASSNGPTTRRAASQPTTRPTAPDTAFATASNKTLPGVDPSWGPSATPAQQARNIANTKKAAEQRQQETAKAQQTAARPLSNTQNKGALQSALERFNLSPAAPTTPAAPAPGRNLRERVLASRANATPQRAPARTPDQMAADVGEQPLSGSVGPHGKNIPADVARVQAALVQNGAMHPATATGYIGTQTLEDIKAFQKKHGLKIDGLIAPGGPTEAALTQDQKAANVGNRITTKDAWAQFDRNIAKNGISFPGNQPTTHDWSRSLTALRYGSTQQYSALAATLSAMAARTPNILDTMPGELSDFVQAYTEHKQNQADMPARPHADDPKYKGNPQKVRLAKKSHEAITARREAEAVRAGVNAVASRYAAKAAQSAVAQTGMDMLDGAMALSGNAVDSALSTRKRAAIANMVPENYRNAPTVSLARGAGKTLGFVGTLNPVGGPLAAAGRSAAETLQQDGSKRDAMRRAYGAAGMDLLGGRLFSAPVKLARSITTPLSKTAAPTTLKDFLGDAVTFEPSRTAHAWSAAETAAGYVGGKGLDLLADREQTQRPDTKKRNTP